MSDDEEKQMKRLTNLDIITQIMEGWPPDVVKSETSFVYMLTAILELQIEYVEGPHYTWNMSVVHKNSGRRYFSVTARDLNAAMMSFHRTAFALLDGLAEMGIHP